VGARAIALASFLLIGEGMVLIGAPLIGAHMGPFLFGSEAPDGTFTRLLLATILMRMAWVLRKW
jgi:hypothetical protein